jgi:hypothetical protein
MKPEETLQRALISTTSRFVGEYSGDSFEITHAGPAFGASRARVFEGPTSRNAFVLSFRTEPWNRDSVIVPDYTHVGDLFCDYLSLLFGKRFDNHGLIEALGHFRVPDLAPYSTFCDHRLPHNSHSPREDFGLSSNLKEVSRLRCFSRTDCWTNSFRDHFEVASRFYGRALRAWERDPEVAYLHLVSAIEVAAHLTDFDCDQLLDEEARQALFKLQNIREVHESSKEACIAVETFLRRRLKQVKRSFVETVLMHLDDGFYLTGEDGTTLYCFTPETIRQNVAAAYDLRSRYLHRGEPFGSYVTTAWPGRGEIPIGRLQAKNAEFSKIVSRAPTIAGMERIVRYMLLKLGSENGGVVLDDEGHDA